MDRKPPWGMVFSVAAVIVALAVLGYAVRRGVTGTGIPLPRSTNSPEVLIEWTGRYGRTSLGRLTNISDQPLIVRRVDYLQPVPVERKGLQVGVAEGMGTNSFVAQGRTTALLDPGESFGFSLMHRVDPLPSRVTVFGDNSTRLRYAERLAPD